MDVRGPSSRVVANPMVLVAVATLLFGWLNGTVGTAAASCVESPPIDQALDRADTVFVGTVTQLENDGRWAVFAVEEVWKGGDLPSQVAVRGGPRPGVATSVDRTFEMGTRYLVVPTGAAGPVMKDNACTATQPFTAELDSLRPANVRSPASGDQVGSQGVPGWGLALIVAAVVGATALAVRIRRTLG